MKQNVGRKKRVRQTLDLITGERPRGLTRETAATRKARLADPTKRHKLTPQVLARADAQRIVTPLVVTLRPGSVYTVIDPKDFPRINVDESYQRLVIKTLVNTLIYVLRNGGDIPAPIHMAERLDGSWWILDGQQRFWAHYETGTPLKAWIHKVQNIQEERDLYIVLNRKVQQSAMNVVKSSNSHISGFIRHWDESDQSPMYRRINFGSHSGRPYDCTVLVRGVSAAVSGTMLPGPMDNILDRTDVEWKKNVVHNNKIADAFLELTTLVWPGPYRVRSLAATAFGIVCHKKWENGVVLPTRTSIAAMRRINWEILAPSKAVKYLSVYVNAIEKSWKS